MCCYFACFSHFPHSPYNLLDSPSEPSLQVNVVNCAYKLMVMQTPYYSQSTFSTALTNHCMFYLDVGCSLVFSTSHPKSLCHIATASVINQWLNPILEILVNVKFVKILWSFGWKCYLIERLGKKSVSQFSMTHLQTLVVISLKV